MTYVLVVDDDPDVRDYIVNDLCARGRSAHGIDDCELALAICEASPPALLVIDQILDNPDSYALLSRLDKSLPGLRVIVLRYDAGPAVRFSSLRVTVIAGEGWFEQLPLAVDRHLLH